MAGDFGGPLFLAAPPIEPEWSARFELGDRSPPATKPGDAYDRFMAALRERPDPAFQEAALFGAISERLSDKFGTRGLPVTLSTACASGATAIQLGVEAIRQGRTDRALTVATDGSVSAEALIRWSHPKLGMVGPSRFVPVAEDSGLVGQIGEWVLRTVCGQIYLWQGEGVTLPVAVNVSARQFQQADLVELVIAVLSETKVPPHLLEIELTESAVMQDGEASVVALERLKSFGVQISIDDFGTGYSSLSYLKRLPLDVLKIDQSFVRDISSDPDDAAIVSAIIAIAHSLGLQVVAEGLETPEQLAYLRSLGCDVAQGYYFSKPLPAAEFGRLLETWSPAARVAVSA